MRREFALCLVLVGCAKPAPEVEPARRVRCALTVVRSVGEVVTLRGTIAPLPDRDVQLAPQVAGRLTTVEVREGDVVTAGQVVARVETASLSDSAAQADAALQRTAAERANADTTLHRTQQVFERGISARQEVDDAVARSAAAKAAEADATAAAHQAHRQVDRTLLRSPIAGTVVRVFRRSGELVDGTPATPVVEVADISRLELAADAPVQDLMRLARGNPATVSFPAVGGLQIAAKVVVVSPSVDRATALGAVRLELTLDGGAPPLGTYGVAHIEQSTARESVWAPEVALRNQMGSDGEVVSCGDDGHAHVLVVNPGAHDSSQVQLSGIDAGVLLVVEGLLGLSDGAQIERQP